MVDKKPKCTCGECNVCKTRARMREQRAKAGGLSARAAGPAANTDNLSKRDLKVAATAVELRNKKIQERINNLFIWVGGNDPGEWDNLGQRIENKAREFDELIQHTRGQISSFSQKPRRNGKLYWYRWVNNAWKYVCPVDKADPRKELFEDLTILEQKKAEKMAAMESCVIKELGDHLLVDTERFTAHVQIGLPDNHILVSDVVRQLPVLGSPGRTTKDINASEVKE